MVKKSFISKLVEKGENVKFPLKKVFVSSLIINFLTALSVLIIQSHLPPQIPLFYGLAEGEEQLIFPLGLIIPALFALVVSIVNAALTLIIKNDFLQKTLILAGFAVTIFSTITTVKIILLVGSF
jgi:hypothetical protein